MATSATRSPTRTAPRSTTHPDLLVALRQQTADVRTRHQAWIREHCGDLPEAADWTRNN
ncbi:hypothetical protein AB0D33_28100 [Streptomyces sp. NPDC048404]|uniref:hypothetical protein n=1 Tax=unclassified Streptomyces TaxID=2593676 RepID=UPI00341F941F